MTERRQQETRYRKRLPVRFWERGEGEEKTRSGFTTNISAGGMYIGSNQVLARGSRVRIEVMDPNHGFFVEGVVTRSERSRPELRSVRSSGMGIRFLPVRELVSELFPKAERMQAMSSTDDETPQLQGPQPVASPRTLPQPGPVPAQARVPVAAVPPPVPHQVVQSAPQQEALAAPPVSTRPARQMRGFAIGYASVDDLRRTYERDILNGGLFVSTQDPAERGDIVMIEIRPPAEVGSPFRLRARVVHTFEPGTQGGTDETNLLAGMGVEWLDPEAARKSFEFYLSDMSSALG